MFAVTVSIQSRSSRRITRSRRTIRSVSPPTYKRRLTRPYPKSISCLRRRKEKFSPFSTPWHSPMSNAAAPAADGPDRTDGPLHVAIIMDGNGRWAAPPRPPRAEAHRRGVDALRRAVRAAGQAGSRYLATFRFSSESWSRAATEIGDGFGLLRRFIRNDVATLHHDGVRVRVIGQRHGLEPDTCSLLNEAEELTKNN